MTRETRVGLLLGLFFIIAFGMILSELKGTGDLAQGPNPPVVEGDYYQYSEPKIEELPFGPVGKDVFQPVQPAQSVQQASSGRDTAADAPHNGTTGIRVLPPPEQGEEIGPFKAAMVWRDPTGDTETAGFNEIKPQPADQPSEPADSRRTYKVQPDDTLYEIARKFYGPNNGHLFKTIYEANRDRLPDASRVYVNQVLVIPPLASRAETASHGTATAAGRPGVRQMDMEELRQFVTARRTGRDKRIYVVQRGDNLTRIAYEMFNDTTRESVERLFEANRDKLRDRNILPEGMKLRIPS